MADLAKTEWFQMLYRFFTQFDSLTWLDYTFLLIVLIGLLVGNRKGFAAIFGNLVLLIITVTLTHQFAEPVARSFPFESPVAKMLMHALSYAALAVTSLFLIGMVLKVIGKVLQFKFSEFIDKLSGSVLGCIYFILLFSFISNFALIFPGDWLHKIYQETAPSGRFLMTLSPKVHQAVMQAIPSEWRGLKFKVHEPS